MADPTFAVKDPSVVLAEALARYRTTTGVTLAPADPRRLHLQALLYEISILRTLINFAGRQNLLRYVGDDYIDELGALWANPRIAAAPSECTLLFTTAALPAVTYTIEAGKRATDGNGNVWAVVETTSSDPGAATVEATARCTVNGASTNGILPGQIDTLVDPIPGISEVTNSTETISGRDLETLEAYRTRLQSEPEAGAVAGPRGAYESLARAASASVEDVKVLGPDDHYDNGGVAPNPGEVWVYITEVDGPEPSAGLISAVQQALDAETVRPLCDYVLVSGPAFVNYGVSATYYIARSRSSSVAEIQAAVDAALTAYLAWQRRIGRDINPSELIARLVAAGAKRVVVGSPTFTTINIGQCARLTGATLAYGGLEND